MAIKEAVFIMFLITLLVATDAKPSGNVFSTSIYDWNERNGIGEQIGEKITKIKELVKKKILKKNRQQLLKLLDELFAMSVECVGVPPEPECEAGWVRHGESCYYINDTLTQTWSAARQACQRHGADLPIIKSAEENQFIADLVFAQNTITWGGAWIGILRNQTDDKLYWIDGTPVAGGYTAWAPTNPSNSGGKEDCGHILGEVGEGYANYNRKWNDVPCYLRASWFQNKYPVILCEKSI